MRGNSQSFKIFAPLCTKGYDIISFLIVHVTRPNPQATESHIDSET